MDIERFIADYILGPVVRMVGLVLRPLDRILARRNERKLKNDVRAAMPFLFELGGRFVINSGVPDVPSFDYAFATVAIGNILIEFFRGRGELHIRIASTDAPKNWEDLQTVLAALDGKTGSEPRVNGIEDAAHLLRSNVSRIAAAYTRKDPDLYKRLADGRIERRVLIKQAEWEINKRLRRQ